MDQRFTLSELNERIRQTLESAFPSSVWVIGEISELKENRNGHCYLELIEKQGEEIVARSRATIWSYTYRMLKPYFETTTGQFFTHGIKILVQAAIEFHPAFGLSLNIKDIDPVYTVGDMAMHRREIIRKLQEEGVFEMNKELRLPVVPQKIAVISSPTAAGYLDFINQLENNEAGFRFYTKLFSAVMQGAETVQSIIGALDKIYQYEDFFDTVVIIRGGGATADLSSFDNYELAYHLTQYPLPVITGIGHEKDDTIIDLVAHTRLKTPTAVAEFLINGMEQFNDRLVELENIIVQNVRETLQTKQHELEKLASLLKHLVNTFISGKQIKLNRRSNELLRQIKHFTHQKENSQNRLKHRVESAVLLWFSTKSSQIRILKKHLNYASSGFFNQRKIELKASEKWLNSGTFKLLAREKERIYFNENTIRLIDPVNVLNRGYTLTLKDGKLIKSGKFLETDDRIETRFADGRVKSKIIKNDNNEY